MLLSHDYKACRFVDFLFSLIFSCMNPSVSYLIFLNGNSIVVMHFFSVFIRWLTVVSSAMTLDVQKSFVFIRIEIGIIIINRRNFQSLSDLCIRCSRIRDTKLRTWSDQSTLSLPIYVAVFSSIICFQFSKRYFLHYSCSNSFRKKTTIRSE